MSSSSLATGIIPMDVEEHARALSTTHSHRNRAETAIHVYFFATGANHQPSSFSSLLAAAATPASIWMRSTFRRVHHVSPRRQLTDGHGMLFRHSCRGNGLLSKVEREAEKIGNVRNFSSSDLKLISGG